MKLRRTSAVAIAAVAALGLAACGSDDGGNGGAGATGGGGETVKVGIKFDQPGLGLKSGATYSGFDVDLANFIAKELNLTPEFVEAVSKQRETLLKTGQVKYIVGTYSITDARLADVSFVGPYFIAGQDLLVRADDTSITGKDSLDGKKLCSVTGSTSAVNLQKEVPGVNLQEYDTYSLCVDALSGMPGVLSARWSGPPKSDDRNNALLRGSSSVELAVGYTINAWSRIKGSSVSLSTDIPPESKSKPMMSAAAN